MFKWHFIKEWIPFQNKIIEQEAKPVHIKSYNIINKNVITNINSIKIFKHKNLPIIIFYKFEFTELCRQTFMWFFHYLYCIE